ncbi:MAG: hypothetical protein ACI9K3_000455 [Halovenus sp.]|jgi:hypothetical protein
MTDNSDTDAGAGTERVWLVEREYTDKGMVTIVYASTDGQRYLQRQLSEQMVVRSDVTAGKDADTDRLEPTPEGERERYAAEASRMAERHSPDDAV